MPETTRFAPSPNGPLHLGHAFAALTAEALADVVHGGRFLVRIEDIDTSRARPEFEAAIFEDLAWLGLAWETPVRRQSEHFEDYRTALDRLREMGVLYPCFCTRRDIEGVLDAPHGPEGIIYPGTCRHLSASEVDARMAQGRPHALRLDLARAMSVTGPARFHESGTPPVGTGGDVTVSAKALAATLGDVVVARKDVPTSYHLSVVVDDALQGVTLVTRGQDLFFATPVQRVLQDLLELPVPRYHHHRLIRDEGGERLAKRRGGETLAGLRARGLAAAELRTRLGFSPRPAGSAQPRP